MVESTSAPTVSVIIPSYNAASYISQAVESALSQKDGEKDVPVEVIVVDDGSTDDTLRVLEGFGPRVRVAKQSRGGPYRARNLGAEMARGEWLALLDADDDWMPGKLASQLALADSETDFVYTDRFNFGDYGRTTERQSDSVKLWEGDVFEPLLMGNFITLSSVLMRKRAFERLGGFNTARRGVQDWDMWLRYAGSGGTVRLCREPLTRYRFHAEQMTNDLDQRAADRESVLRAALESERGRKLPSATTRRALANVWSLAGWHAVERDRAKAVSCYVKAATYWPWNVGTYKNIVKACIGRA
jgi:glycosyltransferase involved in cell wall biosynthesis